MSSTRRSAVMLAALGIAAIVGSGAAFARGGAANLMDSPGYQRALQQERQRLQAQPDAAPAVVAERRRPHRSRHRHHRRME